MVATKAPVYVETDNDTSTRHVAIGRGQVMYSIIDPNLTTATKHTDLDNALGDDHFRIFEIKGLVGKQIIQKLQKEPLNEILTKTGGARAKKVKEILALGGDDIQEINLDDQEVQS